MQVLTNCVLFDLSPEGHDGQPKVFGLTVVVYESDGYRALYTLPDAGQAKYGGWKRDGLEKFVELRDANKEARQSADCEAIEQSILDKIREVNGIKDDTPDTSKSNKRRKTNPELENIEKLAICDDDEE